MKAEQCKFSDMSSQGDPSRGEEAPQPAPAAGLSQPVSSDPLPRSQPIRESSDESDFPLGQARPKRRKRHSSTPASIQRTLDYILHKFDNLEERLARQEQRKQDLSIVSRPTSHSSPVDGRRNSSRPRNPNRAHLRIPSLQELKDDSAVQKRVDRRLRQYEDGSQCEEQGSLHKPIKSGRYRLADQHVQRVVHWPHEFCALADNFQVPTYEEFNYFQWRFANVC